MIPSLIVIAGMSTVIADTAHAEEGMLVLAIYCGSEPCDLTAQGLDQGVVAGPVEVYDLANTEGPVAPSCVPETDVCGNEHQPPVPGFGSLAWVANSVFIDVGQAECDGDAVDNEPGMVVTRFVDVAYAFGEVEPGVALRAGHLWHEVTDLGECFDNYGYWRYYKAVPATPNL